MKSVLLADDNHDIADSFAELLRGYGVPVRVVYDGADAVREASDEMPDLIILDIGMPRMDGLAACRAIRQLPYAEVVKIVALTAWGTIQDREASAEAGFDEHWTKPLNPELFAQLVFGHLGAHPDAPPVHTHSATR